MSKIKVLLTDDHTLFRQGIRTLLAAEPDMEVVGEAADAAESIAL
jgi:DNA-binding NarL/FixJ family response regulator